MATADLRWRLSGGRWYYEDKRFGYGYVDGRDDGWLATVPYTRASKTLDTLREAKNYVQDQVLAKIRRKAAPKRSKT